MLDKFQAQFYQCREYIKLFLMSRENFLETKSMIEWPQREIRTLSFPICERTPFKVDDP